MRVADNETETLKHTHKKPRAKLHSARRKTRQFPRTALTGDDDEEEARLLTLYEAIAGNGPLTLLKKPLALHGTRCNLAAAQEKPSGTPYERCKSGRAG